MHSRRYRRQDDQQKERQEEPMEASFPMAGERVAAREIASTSHVLETEFAMRTFLIAYRFADSAKPGGQDSEPLRRAIESLGTFVRPMESVWIVCTVRSLERVRSTLASFFKTSDRLLIVECSETAEWQGMPVDTAVWLDHEFNAYRRPPIKRQPI